VAPALCDLPPAIRHREEEAHPEEEVLQVQAALQALSGAAEAGEEGLSGP
jgi:hypothetical protein